MLNRCEEMKRNIYMERMSVVKSMICKNGDDYYRHWKIPALGNDTSEIYIWENIWKSTQCLPMPASCSIINMEMKDVVTMNLESDIKVFVLRL